MFNHTARALAAGALGGLLATGPMTVVMLAMHRLLPPGEQYPLPPRLITEAVAAHTEAVAAHTEAVAARSGDEPAAHSESSKRAATWLAHFGFGASAGSLYPFTTGRLRLPPALRGVLFGLLVWAGSYLGWLPALDILPPATRTPLRRNALMIAAHLVWGAAIA